MFGAGHDGRADQRGIIPRAIEYLCHRLEDRRSNGNMEVAIVVSFLEIYLDQIRDLGKVRAHGTYSTSKYCQADVNWHFIHILIPTHLPSAA